MDRLNELRVVVVGCGGMAQAWIDIALKTPGIKVVGLVDARRQAAEEKAQKFNLPPEIVFDTLKEAVKKTKANAVFDVTIPAAHDKVAIEAMKLGCHVLGEKPMSDTLAKARRMVATAQKTGRAYGVTQTRRPLPVRMSVIDLLRSDAIGQIEEVHSDFYIGAHFGGFRDEMDYPLILDMAIHTFDNARQIADADPVSVYCRSWNPKHSWYKGDASGICVFDLIDKQGNPIVYSYRGSWCDEGQQTSWGSDWRIVGSKGTLRWDGEKNIRAQAVKPDGKHSFHSEMIDIPALAPKTLPDGHEAMIHNFVDHLTKGTPLICPCEDNIKSLAMVLAAVESAKVGKPVKVKW